MLCGGILAAATVNGGAAEAQGMAYMGTEVVGKTGWPGAETSTGRDAGTAGGRFSCCGVHGCSERGCLDDCATRLACRASCGGGRGGPCGGGAAGRGGSGCGGGGRAGGGRAYPGPGVAFANPGPWSGRKSAGGACVGGGGRAGGGRGTWRGTAGAGMAGVPGTGAAFCACPTWPAWSMWTGGLAPAPCAVTAAPAPACRCLIQLRVTPTRAGSETDPAPAPQCRPAEPHHVAHGTREAAARCWRDVWLQVSGC